MPVLINHPWQIPMTRCAIETLSVCAEERFELIVVESENHHFERAGPDYALRSHFDYVYLHRPYDAANKNPTADINAGLDLAKAPICVYTGNDVFVRPEWDEALIECFAMPNAGMATLASGDLMGTPPSSLFGARVISEGIYGPFCAFRSEQRFDAKSFPSSWADSDMIMRHYKRGLRMYRNNRVVIEHLNQQTINGPGHEQDFQRAKERFFALHADAQLFVFQCLVQGLIV